MKPTRRRSCLAMCLVLLATCLYAEDEDAMFSSDIIVEDESDGEEAPVPGAEFFRSEKVEWGGAFSSTLGIAAVWLGDTYPSITDLYEEAEAESVFGIDTQLFFDARPTPAYRVYGELQFLYPFVKSVTDAEDEETQVGDIRVTELYCDISLVNAIYIRAGMFDTAWGPGYFFNPVNVFSAEVKDPEDPEATGTAPAGIRLSHSSAMAGIGFHILTDGTTEPKNLQYVITGEGLVDTLEAGIGVSYQIDTPVDILVALSLPLKHIDLFAEARISTGTDVALLRDTTNPALAAIGFETYRDDTHWQIEATAGISYLRTGPNIQINLQYLFRSLGYEDFTLPDRAVDALSSDDPLVIGALSLLDPFPEAEELANFGRHTGAISGLWQSIMGSAFSFSCFGIMDIGDPSGYVSPSITYEPYEGFQIYIEPEFYFGAAFDRRYTQQGTGWQFEMGADIGAGRF